MRKELVIGVVADDITGSNDIGIMFAKWGLETHVYPFTGEECEVYLPDRGNLPQVCILDTNSRLDPADLAYRKVHAATGWLKKAGYRQFFNKTCSVFRGNIGAEFDAMLDSLVLDFGIVVLGFPKNGRVTLGGVHYVHGVPLEDSEFRNDPIHPMRTSKLVDILSAQIRRSVMLLEREEVAMGAEYLGQRIQEMKARCNYLILDVADQAALVTIAQAARDEIVLCGSSALAEELPTAWGICEPEVIDLQLPPLAETGILCTAGSLMPQTAAQVEYLRNQGVPVHVLDNRTLFSETSRSTEIERLVCQVSQALEAQQDVILKSPIGTLEVDRTQDLGRQLGFSTSETGRLVSSTLAEVTARILERSGQKRLIVAGGETSAAVCDRLGIQGMRIWKEIQPGLPSCLSLSGKALLLVLKSGSFGSVDFLGQALDHLRQQ